MSCFKIGLFCCVTSFFSIFGGQLGHQPLAEKDDITRSEAISVGDRSSITIDQERIQLFGVTTENVIYRDLTKTIRTIATIDVDETIISHVQTKFSGWIQNLYANFIGMPVKKGEPLFSVYSQELFATQEEYLIALQDLAAPISGKFAEEFKQASLDLLNSTYDRLLLWDITPGQIEALKTNKAPAKTMTFYSPSQGIILDKKAFIGMNVGPGMTMYSIADLSHVWAFADIYEDSITLIKVGHPATLSTTSFPGASFRGKITFIDYVLDAKTRTARARFEFDNPGYFLKPGMFGTATLDISLGKSLALPESALIDTGERKIIFIYKGYGHFEPREITIGHKAGSYYQVLSGLREGERVVTSSQFLIDSESRLQSRNVKKGTH